MIALFILQQQFIYRTILYTLYFLMYLKLMELKLPSALKLRTINKLTTIERNGRL